MEEFYLQIRNVHIAAVAASGGLFLARALALNLFDARWVMAPHLRFLVYTIDTVLLTAALMLMTIVQQFPLVHAWLTVKILLLAGYVVLGWFTFRAVKRAHRIGYMMGAVAVFLIVVTIARTHHPLGFLAS